MPALQALSAMLQCRRENKTPLNEYTELQEQIKNPSCVLYLFNKHWTYITYWALCWLKEVDTVEVIFVTKSPKFHHSGRG